MSIVGLDFGSHTGLIALWFEDKDTVDVIADDLGSRTIPCAVAYRGDEIITGSAATSQQHKNASNTFGDIRSLLFDAESINVTVPNIDKEVSIQELASHWFRNIHNQIKQQVGKVVRECVIAVPADLSEAVKTRLVEAAQAGGVRLKCMISDSSATLLAYGLDDKSLAPCKVAVVDIGWSHTEVSLYDVSGGLFFPLSSVTSTDNGIMMMLYDMTPHAHENKNCSYKNFKSTLSYNKKIDISGKILVNLLADHCAKDFQRKSKMPCTDSSKSMLRLRKECEDAMKILSTGAEATIDIDSLYEGVDYSAKVTRARFEDLISIPLIQLKKIVNDSLAAASTDAASVTDIALSGGLSAMPRIQAVLKGIFSSANTCKGKFECSEAQCIGAALHGKYLLSQGLIEKAPTASPVAQYLTQPICISTPGGAPSVVFPQGQVLPHKVVIEAAVQQEKGFFQILTSTPAADAPAKSLVSIFTSAIKSAVTTASSTDGLLGEVVFTMPTPVATEGEATTPTVTITLDVSQESGITVEVTSDKVVLANLNIPIA